MSREMLQNLTHFFEYKETTQVVYSLIWISNFLGFDSEKVMYPLLSQCFSAVQIRELKSF